MFVAKYIYMRNSAHDSNCSLPFVHHSTRQRCLLLHGPSMFAAKAKIYGVLYNQASSIAFDETFSYWSALKSS